MKKQKEPSLNAFHDLYAETDCVHERLIVVRLAMRAALRKKHSRSYKDLSFIEDRLLQQMYNDLQTRNPHMAAKVSSRIPA